MFAGEDDVPRTGFVEQFRPFGGLPLLRVFVKNRREIIVVEL